MSDDNKKTYDTDDVYTNYAAKLSQEPKVFPSTKKDDKGRPLPPLVRISFPSTSRQESSKTLWVECKVRDFDANIATYLQKGDVLPIEGKPVWESYTKDGVERMTFKLDNAKLHISVDLLMKLKERGFVPGQAKGGTGGGAPARSAGPAKAARAVQNVDFGDE